MAKRTASVLCAGLIILGSLGLAWGQQPVKKSDNLVELTVTGAGMDKEEAVRDAMRKAVERGAGTFIHSQSETKDFALVRDTILTRAAGFIQSHEILSAQPVEDGTWEVKIKAVVSLQGIEHLWGVVKDLLQRMGRPKIMVFLTETIDEASQPDATVQTRLENVLLKSGFLLVNREQIDAIQQKDLEAAIAEDNPAKMQAIAKDFGAQLFISGSTTADPGRTGQTYGVTLYRYTADGDIKCYRSDTAQLLSSHNGTAYMADKDSPRKAAKRALTALGEKLAPAVQEDILYFWQDALEGRGELILEVEGVSFKQYTQLKKALKELPDVKDVSTQFRNKIAKCSLQSDLRAELLAEKLIEAIENLEITDISQNVIKAQLIE